jgi:anthranilate 1,2-dioxygenase ferredoxin subunit
VTTWHEVVPLADLEDEEPLGVNVDGQDVMVVLVDEQVYALEDLCTHEVAPLSEGYVEDGCIECPLHQGMFDLATGAAVKPPCVEPVRAYPVRVTGAMVEVDLAGTVQG